MGERGERGEERGVEGERGRGGEGEGVQGGRGETGGRGVGGNCIQIPSFLYALNVGNFLHIFVASPDNESFFKNSRHHATRRFFAFASMTR